MITRYLQHKVRPAPIFAAGGRNIACALFAAVLLLTSCGKDEHEPEPAPTLTISPAAESIAFSAVDAKSYTFTVITDQPAWKAVSDQTWCRVETDAEAGTFTVTAQPNYEATEAAPATITVTAGNAAPLTITATQAGARYDVYVVGATDNYNACYWKNGEQIPLYGPDKTKWVSCSSICIDNNSVYIGGSYDRGKISCYWEDGEMKFFAQPKNATISQCNAIAVSDGRVLGVGYANNGKKDYFCYWRDDTLSESFADRNMTSYGEDIVVCDGTVYFLGNFYDGTKTTSWYMKAGDADPVLLEPLSGYTKTEGVAIAVSEGKVYVAGYCEDESSNRTAGYWLDGEFVPLEDSPSGSKLWAEAIAVDNGTVHIAGYQTDGTEYNAFYWNEEQGRTLLSITEGAKETSETRGMVVCGGKVFISGNYYLSNNDKPCYWIDGERFDLPVPNGENAYTFSLAVIKR